MTSKVMTPFQCEAIKNWDNHERKQPIRRCKLGCSLNRSEEFSVFTVELFLEMPNTFFMLKDSFLPDSTFRWRLK